MVRIEDHFSEKRVGNQVGLHFKCGNTGCPETVRYPCQDVQRLHA